jgi:ribosomal protein L44E
MKGKETPMSSQDQTTSSRIKMIKNSWKSKERISTLPKWGQVQNKIIQECLASLPEIDDETKKFITREMLLTLRCHSCERARSDACNFSVCIRGLLSGREVV